MMARIRLKHVSSDVDRHGNVRWYFRRRGAQKIRLPGLPGSAEFMSAYDAALQGVPATVLHQAHKAPAPYTLGWLIQQYFSSAAWKAYAPRTQRVRRRILETVAETAGGERISAITPVVIRGGRDRRADRPEAANAFLKAMRGLFSFAVEYGHASADPTREVKKKRSANPGGWHTWTLEEVEKFQARHPLGTKAHLALNFLLLTGTRRSDVIKIGRQHVLNGWLKFTVSKGSGRQFIVVEIPLLPELRAIISATPKKGDLAFLINDHGNPWASGDSFGNRFRDWCREAGLPHCSPHGLRKAGATIAAENGASDAELAAIFGWIDHKMPALYRMRANRKILAGNAAHHLVPGKSGNRRVPLSPVSPKAWDKWAKKIE